MVIIKGTFKINILYASNAGQMKMCNFACGKKKNSVLLIDQNTFQFVIYFKLLEESLKKQTLAFIFNAIKNCNFIKFNKL